MCTRWSEVDEEVYLQKTTNLLNDLKLSTDIDEKCKQIEDALNEAARLSKKCRSLDANDSAQYNELNNWIEQRRKRPIVTLLNDDDDSPS